MRGVIFIIEIPLPLLMEITKQLMESAINEQIDPASIVKIIMSGDGLTCDVYIKNVGQNLLSNPTISS